MSRRAGGIVCPSVSNAVNPSALESRSSGIDIASSTSNKNRSTTSDATAREEIRFTSRATGGRSVSISSLETLSAACAIEPRQTPCITSSRYDCDRTSLEQNLICKGCARRATTERVRESASLCDLGIDKRTLKTLTFDVISRQTGIGSVECETG